MGAWCLELSGPSFLGKLPGLQQLKIDILGYEVCMRMCPRARLEAWKD